MKDKTDFRGFAFRASGSDTSLPLSAIDLHDNLVEELDRLAAVADLLGAAEKEAPDTLGGVALLLKDIHDRIRAALKAARGGKAG